MTRGLADQLRQTWAAQVESGFVLGDPWAAVETRGALDPVTGVNFRFRWLPHRELRTKPTELERRGILNPDRDESQLFRDPRDKSGRHCFLCPSNVALCHPAELLVPITAGGRSWYAGANFAWLAPDHFTVMAERHIDQVYSLSLLEAMLDLHAQTSGTFRIVFNGAGAGATIPWHLHLHVSSAPMPVETLVLGREDAYPTPLLVLRLSDTTVAQTDGHVSAWIHQDPEHHRVNLLVATVDGTPAVFVFLRDSRLTIATNKGLMGGWEVAGDFAYSEPDSRPDFETANLETVRSALGQIRPSKLGVI